MKEFNARRPGRYRNETPGFLTRGIASLMAVSTLALPVGVKFLTTPDKNFVNESKVTQKDWSFDKNKLPEVPIYAVAKKNQKIVTKEVSRDEAKRLIDTGTPVEITTKEKVVKASATPAPPLAKKAEKSLVGKAASKGNTVSTNSKPSSTSSKATEALRTASATNSEVNEGETLVTTFPEEVTNVKYNAPVVIKKGQGNGIFSTVSKDGYWNVTGSYQGKDIASAVAAARKFSNGTIPDQALCTVSNIRLRCDAAAEMSLLNAEFKKVFKKDIRFNQGYRTYAEQVYLKQWWTSMGKPQNAATPGTSNHGTGMAADLSAPFGSYNTPEHEWLVQHAPSYGWNWPLPMRPGGRGPQEPWHFDFEAPGLNYRPGSDPYTGGGGGTGGTGGGVPTTTTSPSPTSTSSSTPSSTSSSSTSTSVPTSPTRTSSPTTPASTPPTSTTTTPKPTSPSPTVVTPPTSTSTVSPTTTKPLPTPTRSPKPTTTPAATSVPTATP